MVYNGTTYPVAGEPLRNAPQFTSVSLFKVYVLSIMGVVSLIGNLATIWNIQKSLTTRHARHSWSAIYFLILHLSIADLLVTVFCIFGEAWWIYTVEWIAGELSCKLVKLFQMFSLYLSTYVLVLIGVDRWVAVKYPMKSLNTAKRCHRLVICAYVTSFVLSVPQYFIFRVKRGPFVEDFYQCVTYEAYAHKWQEQLYTTFTLVLMYVIPLVVLFLTYNSTFKTISGSERMFESQVNNASDRKQNNRQKIIHRAKMKSLRISVVIVAAFIICWTPYYVMMLFFIFFEPESWLIEHLQTGIFFFGMSNSLMNPVIYGAFQLWPKKKVNNNSNGSTVTKEHSCHDSLHQRKSQRGDKIHSTNTKAHPGHHQSQRQGIPLLPIKP